MKPPSIKIREATAARKSNHWVSATSKRAAKLRPGLPVFVLLDEDAGHAWGAITEVSRNGKMVVFCDYEGHRYQIARNMIDVPPAHGAIDCLIPKRKPVAYARKG